MSGPASSFAARGGVAVDPQEATAASGGRGPGGILVLADIDSNALQVARDELRAEGHEVVTQVTDVSDRE